MFHSGKQTKLIKHLHHSGVASLQIKYNTFSEGLVLFKKKQKIDKINMEVTIQHKIISQLRIKRIRKDNVKKNISYLSNCHNYNRCQSSQLNYNCATIVKITKKKTNDKNKTRKNLLLW